jgi:hypothetical protein
LLRKVSQNDLWAVMPGVEVTFGCRYAPLVGVTSYYGDAMGSRHLPSLATLGAFPGALKCGLGWCGSATISGRVQVA